MSDYVISYQSFTMELFAKVPHFKVEAWQSIQRFDMLVKVHLTFTLRFEYLFSERFDCSYQGNTETN